MRRPLFRDFVKPIRWFICCEISLKHLFKLYLPHPIGIVISKRAIIGNKVRVYANVVIGGNAEVTGKKPIIGDNVIIYSNSTIVGGISIGDNSIIGCNSFVNTNVPKNEVWAGMPAKKVRNFNKSDPNMRR